MCKYGKSKGTRFIPWDDLMNVIYSWDLSTASTSPTAAIDTPTIMWNSDLLPGGDIYEMLTRRVLKLADKSILGDETQTYTKMHPLIDMLRIPTREECTVTTLLAMAFYTGFIATGNKVTDYPEGILKTYRMLEVGRIDLLVTPGFSMTSVLIPKEELASLCDALDKCLRTALRRPC